MMQNKSREFSHHYQSIKCVCCQFNMFWLYFLLILKCKIILANSDDTDETPHYTVSDLDLHCLPMSQTRDDRLTYVHIILIRFGLLMWPPFGKKLLTLLTMYFLFVI